MANAPIQSSNATDSTGNSEFRQKSSVQNRIGRSQSTQSLLFDSLFTSKFFESSLVPPSVPILPPQEQQFEPLRGDGASTGDEFGEKLHQSGEAEASSEDKDAVDESVPANAIVMCFQPSTEVFVEDTSAPVDPICVVKCEAPIQNTIETTSSLELESGPISIEGAASDEVEITSVIPIGAEVDTPTELKLAQNYGTMDKEGRTDKQIVSEKKRSVSESVRELTGEQSNAPTQTQALLQDQVDTGKLDRRLVEEELANPIELQSTELSDKIVAANGQINQQSSQGRRAERLAEKRSNAGLNEKSLEGPPLDQKVEMTMSPEGIPATEPASASQSIQHNAESNQSSLLNISLELSARLPDSTTAPSAQVVSGNTLNTSAPSTRNDASASSAISTARSIDAPVGQGISSTSSFSPAGGLQPKLSGKSSEYEAAVGYQRSDAPVESETLTAYQQSRLLQRVLKGLERFSDGSSNVRLRLHPPELGALEMSLRMNQQQLSATITVESESVRQVLQENVQQLQTKLTEQGITVEKIDFKIQVTQDAERSGSLAHQFFNSNGQSGTNSESGRGRDFGQARANWLRSESGMEAVVPQLDSAGQSASRWNGAGNINIRA